MKNWFEGTLTRRLLSLALSMAMVLSVLPAGAMAEEGESTPPSCTCEVLCAETVNESCPVCSTEMGQCTPTQQQEPEQKQESEQEQKTETCAHGNAPDTCPVCPVQALIEGLPEDVTAENKAAVQSALSAVDEAKAALTESEQAQLDMTRYTALTQKLAALESPAPSATEETTEKTAKVLTDWEWDDGFEIVDEESGYLILPFTAEAFTANFEQVKEMLPGAILVDGETLPLETWAYASGEAGATVIIDSVSYPSPGIFQTTLPEGYVLEDGTKVLSLTVALDDLEGAQAGQLTITPAEPTTGIYIIDGASVTAYQLSSAEHLYWFAQQVNGGKTEINAVLTANITVNSNVLNNDGSLNETRASTFEKWTPIGDWHTQNGSSMYCGKFDGQDHTISGLYVKDATASYIGLFGMLGNPSFVTRVTVADSYFSGSHYIGGICGSNYEYPISYCKNYATVCGSGANNRGDAFVGGICGVDGQLSHCENYGLVTGSGKRVGGICGSSATVSDCKNFGAVQGDVDFVGGIVGYSTASISNSENHGAVQGSSECVGGICGLSTGSSVSVKNCSNFSRVQGDKAMVGGIVGQNSATVENCTNKSSAPVTGGVQFTGGIVGQNTESGKVTGCQNEATVTGHKIVGGIVGHNYTNAQVSGCTNTGSVTGSSTFIGGIVGDLETGTVTGCDSSGIIKGTSSVGGIVGQINNSGTIQTCKNSGTVTGCNSDGETTSNNTDVGGICGDNMGGEVRNCENSGVAVSGYGNVGGICGRSYEECTILDCKNSGKVTGGDTSVGGICGIYQWTRNQYKMTVTNCENSGKVTGRYQVGGVCGFLPHGTINGCVNTGEIMSRDGNNGGICGSTSGSGNNYTVEISESYNTGSVKSDSGYGTGGICGYFWLNQNSSIAQCYNSASVSGGLDVGGICGNANGSAGKITNCYYLEGNSATGEGAADSSVVAKTAEQFASGEVAYLLNGSSSSGIWKQNIDKEGASRDETPNFSGAAVYAATSGECPSDTSLSRGYTNDPNGAKKHIIEGHLCVFCGYRDQYPITVSGITAVDKTYDGSNSAELVVTFTGKQDSYPNVSVTATGTFKDANAGTNKTVTVSNPRLTGSDAGKYYLEYSGPSTTTGTITPKNITVTFTPDNITYGDGTTVSPKFSGVVGNDDLKETLTYSGTANDGTSYSGTTAPTKAGTYTVTASINNNNYKLTGTTKADFKIEKATVTTPTLQSVTYDGNEHSPTISDGALYELSENFSKKDAYTYPLTLALKDPHNYKWDDKNGATSFTIEKKSLTVTVESKTVTFGDPAPEYTARYEGFVTGETAESLNCVPTFTCNYSVGTSVNQSGYPISVSDLVLSNYEIRYEPGTLTVNPKTLDDSNVTLTVADENLVYTGSALTPDVSVVWGDKTLTKDTDYTVDYSNNVNAGSTPQVTITGTGNYTGTKSKSFTIQPRDISSVAIAVTGDGSLKYIGSEIKPAVTVTNGDYAIAATDYEVSYENNVAAGQNTATVKLTGKNNYTGTASQTFSIEKADSTVSTAPAAVSGLTYTGQAQTLVTDGSTDHGTMVYSLEENGTYTSNLPTGTNAGSYTVWYKVQGNDNHLDSAPVSVTCSIAQKSLTVTAKDHTITYGDAPANNGVAYDGFVNGETKLDGELTYTYTYSQYGNVGRYDIIPSGLTSGNYAITFEQGTLTVQQKEIGISWGNTQLTYNGSAQKPTATPTDMVNNDDITLTVTGEKINAGNDYTAQVDAIQGTKAGNYALPQSVTTPFSIEKKEVTITGTTVAATKVYDGNTTAQITSDGELQGKCDGDNLTIIPGSAAYNNKNVGESKPVTFSDFSLGGSAAGNYTLTAQPASVTASITKKPVTLAITVGENLFDGTNGVNYSTSLEEGQSFVENDDVAIESGNATFAYCYPAENIPVTFTAFSLTGVDAGNYSITNPTPENVTGSIKVSNRYLNLGNNGDFAGQTEVWVDGVACPVRADDGTYAALPESGDLLTTYTYKQGTSTAAHENYPTGMALYSIVRDDGGAKLQKIDELDNLLQYSGCSIRINGKPGIRMITSLTKEAKEALKKGELAGYTLEEYGTVVAWDVGADMQLPLTLGNGNKHNYAYKKGVSDPVFSNVDNLTQYTNVLVWDSLTDAQLAQDILMRPYIILSKDDGKTVTLYGGTVSRSIGYVAQQNADTFPKGSAGYNYVHDIIDRVANLNQSNGSTTTAGGNEE